GSSTSTGPTPVFTSVAVTPVSPSVNVGAAQAMTAIAKDQNGAAFAGAPAATWTSSDVTKATVDPSTGVVSGVANGASTITASITAGSVTHTGTSQVTVITPSSTAGVTATSTLTFDPHSVTIARAGGTGVVTWTFQSVAHTVSFDAEPTGASVTDIDATSSAQVARNFSVPGNYTYHCSIHPTMTGVVVVQ
ncbi:MAG: Ig-like domain-containing protein, partial [Gemmatimonadaceae bacterium]|nr:Ig-like domain-containing protein [Gemmatimonadaceae bacterium]